MKGLFNNQGRKSGGYRKDKINISPVFHRETSGWASVSPGCFEHRHEDCSKKVFGFPGSCECKCHDSQNKHSSEPEGTEKV